MPGYGWRPRFYQKPLWDYLKAGGKRAAAVWHRRSGKDATMVNWAARSSQLRVGNYWHMLPEQRQGRKVVWEAVIPQEDGNPLGGMRLIDQAFPKEIRDSIREDEMVIRLKTGSTFQVVGSDNYNSLMGATPVGVTFSEWALARPVAWDFIRPILMQNNGWAAFIFTPRGYNHGWDLYQMAKDNPDWFVSHLTATDTGVVTPEMIDAERMSGMADEFIQQEYFCSFNSPLAGSYFGRELNQIEAAGQITKVPAVPDQPCQTAWDIGYTDDTAIWVFQPGFLGVRIVDCYSSYGQGVEHYANVIRSMPYTFSDHWLPPDAKARTLAAGGRSVIEQLTNLLGIEKCHMLGKQNPTDWIAAARAVLPRCHFDKDKCAPGLKALRAFQRVWDEDRKCFREQYDHDWSSHFASAFGVFASVYVDGNPNVAPPAQFRAPSLDEIYARREGGGKAVRNRI